MAGGTFEDNAVEQVLIQQTADLLGNPLGGFYPTLLRFKMDRCRTRSSKLLSGEFDRAPASHLGITEEDLDGINRIRFGPRCRKVIEEWIKRS